MKKIIGLVAIVLVGFLGFSGYKYWNETYNGKVSYALVPTEIPEKQETVDASGVVQEGLFSYKYSFDFVNEDGSHQPMTFELTGENPEPFAPNTIVRAKVSQKRVTEGPNHVEENTVPKKVLDILKGN